MNYKICVIGNEALLFPFLQFGFNAFSPETEEDLRECLKDVIEKNYGIIYLEDSYCFMVKDVIDKYKYSLTPIFIPIGGRREGESYSEQQAREMMETAVGMNVL
ncbi:MAG: hypothetical protein FWH55_08005 [Oscillospiraceae bacterium]|nr:hypothetical protein [Oscillospiraceae bacterium]